MPSLGVRSPYCAPFPLTYRADGVLVDSDRNNPAFQGKHLDSRRIKWAWESSSKYLNAHRLPWKQYVRVMRLLSSLAGLALQL